MYKKEYWLNCICKDIENVENYEKAKADNFIGWRCHHRLETHNSDGERRSVDITHKELIALDMYWHRPANELIFMTIPEHSELHGCSEDTRRKISEAHKGKHLSDEHRRKISEGNKGKAGYWEGKVGPMKGKQHSDETRRKISEASKGKHWFTNGKIDIRAKECPSGFVPGRVPRSGI